MRIPVFGKASEPSGPCIILSAHSACSLETNREEGKDKSDNQAKLLVEGSFVNFIQKLMHDCGKALMRLSDK